MSRLTRPPCGRPSNSAKLFYGLPAPKRLFDTATTTVATITTMAKAVERYGPNVTMREVLGTPAGVHRDVGAVMSNFLFDWVIPYWIWIVSIPAALWWYWHARRHHLRWTDPPRWARKR